MTEIPEDVMKAAAETVMSMGLETVGTGHVLAVARAILAEREQAEADAARLRGLLAEAGKALEPFAAQAASYDPDEGDGDLPVWDFEPKTRELRTARTVATKIEALK